MPARDPAAEEFGLVVIEGNAGRGFCQHFTGIQRGPGPHAFGEDVQNSLQTKGCVFRGVRAHASPSTVDTPQQFANDLLIPTTAQGKHRVS